MINVYLNLQGANISGFSGTIAGNIQKLRENDLIVSYDLSLNVVKVKTKDSEYTINCQNNMGTIWIYHYFTEPQYTPRLVEFCQSGKTYLELMTMFQKNL